MQKNKPFTKYGKSVLNNRSSAIISHLTSNNDNTSIFTINISIELRTAKRSMIIYVFKHWIRAITLGLKETYII